MWCDCTNLTLFCTVCPAGTEYHDCSWMLSCNNITVITRCSDRYPCTSGCFCSDGTVLINGICSNISSCLGMYNSEHVPLKHLYHVSKALTYVSKFAIQFFPLANVCNVAIEIYNQFLFVIFCNPYSSQYSNSSSNFYTHVAT